MKKANVILIISLLASINFCYARDEVTSHKSLKIQALEFEKKKDYSHAIKLYEKLLKTDPTNTFYLSHLGVLYSKVGKYDLAEKYLREVLKALPKDYDARFALAQVYYWKKEYKSSLDEANMLLEQNSNNTDVLILLGRIYLRMGDEIDAQFYFNKALILNPNSPEASAALSKLFLKHKKYRKANKHLKQVLYTDPSPDNRQLYLQTRLYTAPSIETSIQEAQEREMDLVRKIKTTQIDNFNSTSKVYIPIMDHLTAFLYFTYAPEIQKNLLLARNNYAIDNFRYGVGTESVFGDDWELKVDVFVKNTNQSEFSLYPFQSSTKFEPALSLKYFSGNQLVFLGSYVDSLVGKSFETTNYSYLVERYHFNALYEWRFKPPYSAIGLEGILIEYIKPRDNTKYEADFWGRLGFSAFTFGFMGTYYYKYKQFDRVIVDYYSYKHEVEHLLKASLLKGWNPYGELEISYSHTWKYVRDLTNEAVAVADYGVVPEVLQINRYQANIFDAILKFNINNYLNVQLSTKLYKDTDEYNTWMVKALAHLIF
jgi:tetratricopeptide (TPR) repeat protein